MQPTADSCFDALSDWREPENTQQLCEHVATHGTAEWEQLGKQLGCPPTLCALRWHVLWLEHINPACANKALNVYSDWERCVLYLALHPSLLLDHNKRTRFQALTRWIPGRSATGLKQAHIAHVQGSESKALAMLKEHNWPRDLTGLLAAWPGPLPHVEERARQGAQESACAILAAAGSTAVTITSQKPAGLKRRKARDATAAAQSCSGASEGTPLEPPNKARRLQLAQCSRGALQPMQRLALSGPVAAAWPAQQQQRIQCILPQQAAGAGAKPAPAAPDFEQILYDTIHEMLNGNEVFGSAGSGGNSSLRSPAALPSVPQTLAPAQSAPAELPRLPQQRLQPVLQANMQHSQPMPAQQVQQHLIPGGLDSAQDGAVAAAGDISTDSLRSIQGSSTVLVTSDGCVSDAQQAMQGVAACCAQPSESSPSSHNSLGLEVCHSGVLPGTSSQAFAWKQPQQLPQVQAPQQLQQQGNPGKADFTTRAPQQQEQEPQGCIDACAWQLVTMLQQRVGQLEEQQQALLGRIDQLQGCLEQVQQQHPQRQ